MAGFFKWIKAKLTWLIPISIALGLIAGLQGDVRFLKAWITPVLFIMVYPIMLSVQFKDLIEALKAPKTVLISLAINYLFVPVFAFAIGEVFFASDPMVQVGMVLIGLIPTSGMTASWTGLAGGKVQNAVVLMTVNLLFSILMIPLWLQVLFGQSVDMNTTAILMSLLKVVIAPLVAASVTRPMLLKWKGAAGLKKIKPIFGGVSSTGVLFIVFIAIALKAKTIWAQPLTAGSMILPLILFYGVLMMGVHLLANRRMQARDRIPLVYATSLRNLTIALGISLSGFGESLAVLLIAIAYIVQLPFAALYMQKFSVNRTGNEQPEAVMK